MHLSADFRVKGGYKVIIRLNSHFVDTSSLSLTSHVVYKVSVSFSLPGKDLFHRCTVELGLFAM